MNPQTIIFIGRSGCGKGTQAKLLIDYLKTRSPEWGLYYLESGAVFRRFIDGTSYAATLAKKIYEAGGLQPEFLAVWVWANLFIENIKGEEHLVIDGTPRKRREAAVLDTAFTFYRRESPQIIHIDVSRSWSTARLTDRKRPDDNPGDIDARLNWFESEVKPAIKFFRGNSYYKVHDINGEQPVEKVFEDLIASLGWSR